jgi:hypothetical protein
MRLKINGILVPAGILFLLLFCTKPNKEAGGGSDTPNPPACKVKGNAFIPDNSRNIGLEDFKVSLYNITAEDTAGYEWSLADSTLTDVNGAFGFDSLAAGFHSIVLEKDIFKAFTGYFNHRGNDSTIDLGMVPAEKTTNIAGIIESKYPYNSLVLGLVGTPFGDTVIDDGFKLNDIPGGSYKMEIILQAVSDSTNYASNVVNNKPSADTSYLIDDSDLPIGPAGQADSVKIVSDTIEISGENFTIKYTVSEN